MPRGDGTGPYGMGPGTGRGMGPCSGYAGAPYAGYGLGCGRGRGFRRMAVQRYGYPEVNLETELNQEKAVLENRLNQINEQLKNRESKE